MADEPESEKKPGRPLKVDGPKIQYQQLDSLLVFGELVDPGDGSEPEVVFPSYRQLADRFGVAHSVVAEYAKKHNCLRRRKHAQARIEARTDAKLVEARATAIALGKDDAVRIIDAYLVGFEKAVAEGRVRFDSPADFNSMLRLKEFILGGADSRQEVHAALSLEDLQSRHRHMLKVIETTTEAERGGLESKAAVPGTDRVGLDPPPALPAESDQQPTVRFLDGSDSDQCSESVEDGSGFEEDASQGPESAQQEADSGATEGESAARANTGCDLEATDAVQEDES